MDSAGELRAQTSKGPGGKEVQREGQVERSEAGLGLCSAKGRSQGQCSGVQVTVKAVNESGARTIEVSGLGDSQGPNHKYLLYTNRTIPIRPCKFSLYRTPRVEGVKRGI